MRCNKCGRDKPRATGFYPNQKRHRKGKPVYYDSICKKCRIKTKTTSLFKRYGLTQQEYDRLPKRCEICGSKKRLVFDHDHQTLLFRGRLCGACNNGLGMFHDSVVKLKKAIQYLEKV